MGGRQTTKPSHQQKTVQLMAQTCKEIQKRKREKRRRVNCQNTIMTSQDDARQD